MIQEYLFSGEKYRYEVEHYTYKSVKVKTYDIENSDCWIVTFSLDGENERNANILSVVNDFVVDKFHPTILSNGCSAYYNRALYPRFNEFERKLRKLLYLKSALSQDTGDTGVIKDLESKDLGEIFTLLFSDAQFVKDVKKSINEKTWQFTKTEILATLQQISESTLWDRLIGNDAVPSLSTDFTQVKQFRNDVMHAHNMGTVSYNSALNLLKGINRQLDIEIDKIIIAKAKTPQHEDRQDFNTVIENAIKEMNTTKQDWREQLAEVQASISTFNNAGMLAALEEYNRIASSPEFNAIKTYLSSYEFSQIQKNIEQISKIKMDIPPALQEIQKIAGSIKIPEFEAPAALLELQKSLQDLKIDLENPKESPEETAEDKTDEPHEI